MIASLLLHITYRDVTRAQKLILPSVSVERASQLRLNRIMLKNMLTLVRQSKLWLKHVVNSYDHEHEKSNAQSLRVLTWNASTLSAARRDELFHFLAKNSIHIAFISEVKNKSQVKMNLVEYEQYVAIDTWCFVQKSIQHSCLLRIETHKLELIMMKVGKIKILGCYIRSRDSSMELNNIIKLTCEYEVDIIMGDLNANTSLPNKCGSALFEFLMENDDWTSLNTSHTSIFRKINVTHSELDYVLCHDRILHQVSEFAVIDDLDSDHYPLLTEFFGSETQHILPNTPLLFSMNLHAKQFNEKFTEKLLQH